MDLWQSDSASQGEAPEVREAPGISLAAALNGTDNQVFKERARNKIRFMLNGNAGLCGPGQNGLLNFWSRIVDACSTVQLLPLSQGRERQGHRSNNRPRS